ncbi:uncharacterized protein LOC125484853 [Rhincodon typus]|uniref:uncharacterized protein LOC125484853 n=1 Tax=Rhincodon typus TaxID=259920 RepID=UPI00202DCFFF|nr:uncharacterized protein LOC125484853 [Rhincodon typus]
MDSYHSSIFMHNDIEVFLKHNTVSVPVIDRVPVPVIDRVSVPVIDSYRKRKRRSEAVTERISEAEPLTKGGRHGQAGHFREPGHKEATALGHRLRASELGFTGKLLILAEIWCQGKSLLSPSCHCLCAALHRERQPAGCVPLCTGSVSALFGKVAHALSRSEAHLGVDINTISFPLSCPWNDSEESMNCCPDLHQQRAGFEPGTARSVSAFLKF